MMLRLISLLLLLLSSSATMALSYTVEISEAELQEKIETMMPMEKKKFFVTVVFSHPKIELAENANQIGIYSQLDVAAPGGIKSTGNTKITGSLSYDSTKSEFYFKNPAIVAMKFDKVPDAYIPTIKEIAQLVVSKILSSTPIYKLKGGDLKRDLTKSMLKSVVVENKQLLVELELF
jgi:Protein of unknown function (DUF1439)